MNKKHQFEQRGYDVKHTGIDTRMRGKNEKGGVGR